MLGCLFVVYSVYLLPTSHLCISSNRHERFGATQTLPSLEVLPIVQPSPLPSHTSSVQCLSFCNTYPPPSLPESASILLSQLLFSVALHSETQPQNRLV